MATQGEKIEGRFVVVAESPIVKWVTLALTVLGPLFLLGALTRVAPFGVVGPHLFFVGLLGRRFQRRTNFGARRVERRVSFDADGVTVDGVLVVPRTQIAEGRFQPRPPRNPNKARSVGSTVRLLDKRGGILFEQEADEAKALEILRFLELDASRRRAEFLASSPVLATIDRSVGFTFAMVGLGFLIVLLFSALGVRPLAPLGAILAALSVLIASRSSRVLVGADGILLRWLWRSRFVPLAKIVAADPIGDRQILVRLEGGGVERIFTSPARNRGAHIPQHRDAVLARIRQVLARRVEPSVDVAALVGQGGRAFDEWRGSLEKLLDTHGYRQGVIRAEDLWNVLEDPTASGDARAGAALALRSRLDADGKARVRIAAEATASPQLRVALEAVAGESDEVAGEALADLARDVPEKRAV